MRFAYADPPYLGMCGHHYNHEHHGGGCWDEFGTHYELIAKLEDEFPDGWALSCSVPSLRTLLPCFRDKVRIGAWVKPFASWKPNVNPAYAWEPVIFSGGRAAAERDGDTTRDWVSCNITMQRGTSGVKPDEFCFWIFDLLGAQKGDEMVDLFPGSGAVGRAWLKWDRSRQESLAL